MGPHRVLVTSHAAFSISVGNSISQFHENIAHCIPSHDHDGPISVFQSAMIPAWVGPDPTSLNP